MSFKDLTLQTIKTFISYSITWFLKICSESESSKTSSYKKNDWNLIDKSYL